MFCCQVINDETITPRDISEKLGLVTEDNMRDSKCPVILNEEIDHGGSNIMKENINIECSGLG